jgi:hypothetical protein
MPAIGKKAILKMHLTLNGCVAMRFKMLTDFAYAPLLNPNRRLALLNTIMFLKSNVKSRIHAGNVIYHF